MRLPFPMILFYLLLHCLRILVVNSYIDFTTPLWTVQMPQLLTLINGTWYCHPPNSLMLKNWGCYRTASTGPLALPPGALLSSSRLAETLWQMRGGMQLAIWAFLRLMWSGLSLKNTGHLILLWWAHYPKDVKLSHCSSSYQHQESECCLTDAEEKVCGHWTPSYPGLWVPCSNLRIKQPRKKCIHSKCPQIQLMHCSVFWTGMSIIFLTLAKKVCPGDIISEFKVDKGIKDVSPEEESDGNIPLHWPSDST